MANVDAPFGLKPVRYKNGQPYNGACRNYFATGASGAMYIGDPVIRAGSSNTAAQGYGHNIAALPTCSLVTAGDGNAITGIVVGVMPITTSAPNTGLIYRANSTDRIIQVADDPDLVFIGQTDDASTDWAATDVGSYANLVGSGGSTVTGLSAMELDTTDGPSTTDESNQLVIWGLHDRPGNAIGDYSVWEVVINLHTDENIGLARYNAF